MGAEHQASGWTLEQALRCTADRSILTKVNLTNLNAKPAVDELNQLEAQLWQHLREGRLVATGSIGGVRPTVLNLDVAFQIVDWRSSTIKQKGNKLSYKVESETKGKKNGFEVDLTIGGEGYESDAAGVVSAEWKDSSLVITTLFNPTSDHPSDQTETWVLSEDGNKLVDELEYHGKQGTARISRVFDKQR